MVTAQRSQRNMHLAGVLLLVISGRIFLSCGGIEAMAFTSPRFGSLHEAMTLLARAAVAIALSAVIAVVGKRWAGPVACVGLGGIAGLLAISQYNAILGAVIGLAVGLLVACGNFLALPLAVTRVVAAFAFGVACGSAALATQRDLSSGHGPGVLLLMTATVTGAAILLFRRCGRLVPAEWKHRWMERLGRTTLLLTVTLGVWVSLSVDTVRRVNRFGTQLNTNPLAPELPWLWRGCVQVIGLSGRHALTDADLSNVRGFPDLEFLDLSGTSVTDPGLAQLRELPRIQCLFLRGTSITGEGFEQLATLPALTHLNLEDTQLSDESVYALEKLAALRWLSLEDTPITDKALASVGTLSALQSLNLRGTAITSDGLKRLQSLSSLDDLCLSYTQITGDGLQHLAPLVRLQFLDLSNTQVTDASLAKLPMLPRLALLRLDGTKISDAGLSHLKKLPLLSFLDVEETAVTAEAAKQFSKTMSQCVVER